MMMEVMTMKRMVVMAVKMMTMKKMVMNMMMVIRC